MDIESVRKAYRRHAHFYDIYCGKLMEPGRRQTLDLMTCRPGDRVLEVGVGTGLSLPMYPAGVHVTGIDLSSEMLAQAHEKIRAERLANAAVCEMNAEQMAFPDGTFDKVVAMYVASTVPNPERLVAEMRRVCRSDAGIFILNHFFSGEGLIGQAEKLVAPLGAFLGWRPDFSLDGSATGRSSRPAASPAGRTAARRSRPPGPRYARVREPARIARARRAPCSCVRPTVALRLLAPWSECSLLVAARELQCGLGVT